MGFTRRRVRNYIMRYMCREAYQHYSYNQDGRLYISPLSSRFSMNGRYDIARSDVYEEPCGERKQYAFGYADLASKSIYDRSTDDGCKCADDIHKQYVSTLHPLRE